MISVRNLSVYFSGNPLFKGIDFVVGDNERVGLVGRNGVGKTTLLRILARELEPESGEMVLTKGFRIGYLPQEMKIQSDKTVWDKTLEAFDEIRGIDREMERLNTRIAEREDYEAEAYAAAIDRLNELSHRRQYLGAAHMEADMSRVLTGLGFTPEDFQRPVTAFSSGWQMRIELAKILLRRTEVILLDEPTNHLDIESIQWLEDFLQKYRGSLIMVSHDRRFLNSICSRTIEITFGHIEDYKCCYNDYVDRRLERIAHQRKVQENQQKEISDIEAFIERFRYKATKAKQVQSRIKQLERMEMVQVDELDTSRIHFLFPPAPKCNRVVFEATDLSFAYEPGKPILRNVDWVIEAREKVAFIGKNGEGKSTMMKLLTQELLPQSGRLQTGDMVRIGYYAQNQNQMLDTSRTVLQTLDDVAVGDIRLKIRGILGSFLFEEEDMSKKVAVLSGGEKARLALAKLLLEPYNVLLLDEPTNHLDMTSKDVLKNALLRYDGTLVIVSHDRDFLQGLTDKVFEFKNKGIKVHLGDIQDYLDQRQWETLNAPANRPMTEASGTEASSGKNQWEEQKRKESIVRKLEKTVQRIEDAIEAKEKELAACEEMMNNAEQYAADMASGKLYQTYQSLKNDLDRLMQEWETASAEREEARRQ
ncbi:MAG: ABC-F family ATP-binding cassette domain-containing protein [Bacteroidales bacterium]|nr:ABC-F family ATP-binding cassette domain-containing protein [Bacteroidales bacterium]